MSKFNNNAQKNDEGKDTHFDKRISPQENEDTSVEDNENDIQFSDTPFNKKRFGHKPFHKGPTPKFFSGRGPYGVGINPGYGPNMPYGCWRRPSFLGIVIKFLLATALIGGFFRLIFFGFNGYIPEGHRHGYYGGTNIEQHSDPTNIKQVDTGSTQEYSGSMQK